MNESSSMQRGQALPQGAHPARDLEPNASASNAHGNQSLSGPPIVVPLALLLVATLLIGMLDLDRVIARLIYHPQSGWILGEHRFVKFLYDYGTWPAILVACVTGVIWLACLFHAPLRRKYRLAIYVGLSIALGPGLMVNTLFKGYYGRPRPAEVIEFGGNKNFAAVWEPRFASGSRSFPSGHASMGFFWVSLALYFSERNRRLALAFALLALLHGGVMGWGRMMQGGHWLTDVLWAAGLVYLAAWILYHALRLSPTSATSSSHEPASPS